MLRQHYRIETDVARVYKVRAKGRHGWGWAIATIREWPHGGQIDVQSDFGNFAYAWVAIGDRTLREFLCGLHFDYFMNKAAPSYREFDQDATVRKLKADIFDDLRNGMIDRATAHERRDDIDDIVYSESEHIFAERLMGLPWFYDAYDYPTFEYRDKPNYRAFWEGPWVALCNHWKSETAALAA